MKTNLNIETTNNENEYIDLANKDTSFFKHLFKNHADIEINEKLISMQHSEKDTLLQYSENEHFQLIFIFTDTMISQSQVIKTVLPALNDTFNQLHELTIDKLKANLSINWVLIASKQEAITLHRLSSFIFEGNLIIYLPKLEALFAITIPSYPKRQPADAASETSIRGSRDGLVEEIGSNIALIRKRIRNIHLVCKTYSIGELTNTKVAVLYMDNKIAEHVSTTLIERINNIAVDSLLTIGELEQLISDKNRLFSFPVVDHSGRPDFIAKNLLEGRFVVLVDNNPIALIGPCNLTNFLRSPEDNYFPLMATNIGILIRACSLLITIFLPSFFIAIITYHPDQIPFQLLSTISVARLGLPVEAPLELFLIMFLMEMFREATFRMPTSIAQTVTVVGGLIIGEASINAGLVSPIIVVVAALTIVASATLVNQSVTTTAVLLRFVCFIFSSILGMLGFILSFFTLIVILTRVKSFGVPYLVMMTPMYWGKLAHSFFQLPMNWFGSMRKKKETE